MIHLTNKNNYTVILTEIGAGIVSVLVPNRNGEMKDIVLGYANEEDYFYDGPCSGKIPGRFAGRISNASFLIDGKEFKLDQNKGKHHLHGGSEGFSNRKWGIDYSDNQRVIFSLTSPDGDQGYPGELRVTAEYNWSDDNVLSLDIKAKSSKDTVVNLTNHTYWNLKGEDSGSILDHSLEILAEEWLPTDEDLIPTGKINSVANTPMDFRLPKEIGKEIFNEFEALKIGKGYDNCWILGSEHNLKKGVVLSHQDSGISLEVWTTQIAAVIYTGNWLNGSPISKSGRRYNDYDGVAIECQGYPDAPNKNNFPSTTLKAGEEYSERIEFRINLESLL